MQVNDQSAFAGRKKVDFASIYTFVKELKFEYRLASTQDVANTAMFFVLTNFSL